MKKLSFLLSLTVLTFSCKQYTKPADRKSTTKKEQSLTSDFDTATIKKHLYPLASDDMQGRATGTPGIEKAAQYIENEFKKIGLSYYDTLTSYRQNFEERNIKMFNVVGVLEGKSKKDFFS